MNTFQKKPNRALGSRLQAPGNIPRQVVFLSYSGQSTLTYVIFFAIVTSALITAQVYAKRGFMGRYHELFSPWGDAYIPGRTNADDHLIETGTSSDTLDITKDTSDPNSSERITTVTYKVDSTVQESGGDAVTVEKSKGLF